VPLYEYKCPKCGQFELIQKFSDAPLTVCPTCGREVQKLLSAPAIQFKGSGWYVTDYARKSSGGAGKGDGSKAGEGAGKGDASASASTSSKDASTKEASASGSKDSTGKSSGSSAK
jgi:putative FmdB family regulatory protein